MKKKESTEEKLFEVVIPPTDVLEKELQEVLGGLAEASCFTCTGTFNCDNFSVDQLDQGTSDTDCPANYVLRDGYCIPRHWVY